MSYKKSKKPKKALHYSNSVPFRSKTFNSIKKMFKKIKYHIFEDESIVGWIFAFVAMFLFLKFLALPLVGLFLNTGYPIVAVVSGSMEHRLDPNGLVCGKKPLDYNPDFENWWNVCGSYYEENFEITKQEFSRYSQPNGFNIGDVMVLYGTKPKNVKEGDIIVFEGGRSKPIIHRVTKVKFEDETYYFTTKGDHNEETYGFETDIHESKLIGRAVIKIPFIGYVKIVVVNIFTELINLFR